MTGEPLNEIAKEFLRVEKFIKAYCPKIANVKHKLRGKNGRGNPIDFTDTDKKEIITAVQRFAKEIVDH